MVATRKPVKTAPAAYALIAHLHNGAGQRNHEVARTVRDAPVYCQSGEARCAAQPPTRPDEHVSCLLYEDEIRSVEGPDAGAQIFRTGDPYPPAWGLERGEPWSHAP